MSRLRKTPLPEYDDDHAIPVLAEDDYAGVPRFTSYSRALAFVHTCDRSPDSDPVAPATPVAICVRVAGIDILPRAAGHRVRFEDLEGQTAFSSRPVPHGHPLYTAALDALKAGRRSLLFCCFPAEDGDAAVLDLRLLTNQASMLGYNQEEYAEALALARTLIAEGRVQQWLIQEAREILGVQTSSLSARFRLCEEAAVLQALAYAQVQRTLNSRLSIYLVSGPGAGKDLLADYALLFSAIGDRFQPPHISSSGLGATCRMIKKGWDAVAGALPGYSGGTVVIDDLQRWEKRDVNQFHALLMSTAHEGVVRSTKAARAVFEARTSLFLTSNQLSLRTGGTAQTPQERADDLVLPFDILSRIDLMINLGPGDEALRSAMAIASSPACTEHAPEQDENRATPKTPSAASQRERRVKLVVALIKDLIPLVDFTPVEEDLEETTLALGAVLREYTARLGTGDEDSHDGEGLIRRMANALRKLVGAIARSEGRSVAEKRDLDRAWEMLSPKMEVVRWIAGDTDKVRTLPSRAQQVEMMLRASAERWQRVMGELGGQRVHIGQVMAAAGCTEKTARRELAKRGIEPDGVWYLIPTEIEYALRGVKLDLRSELIMPPADNGMDDLPAAAVAEPVVRFNDGLPEPPPECQYALAGLAMMDVGSQCAAIEQLFEMALRPSPHWRGQLRLAVYMPLTYSVTSGELAPPDEVMDRLYEWVAVEDWEQRGLRALGLYAASGMRDELGRLKTLEAERDEKQDGPWPEALRQGVAAVKARLQYHRDQLIEEARALAVKMFGEEVPLPRQAQA